MKIFLCDLIHNFKSVHDDVGELVESSAVVPLNVASIAAYAMQAFPGALDITLFKYPNQILAAMEISEPAILGLSNYGWNVDINQRVIEQAKQKYPNLLVVMGGPNIRIDANGITDFLLQRPLIDVYVMFQGEWPFVEILRAYKAHGRAFLSQDLELANCAYLLNNRLIYHPDKLVRDLGELPSPYITGLLDPFLTGQLVPIFETNRGCPYSCTFCAWGVAALSKVRSFPLGRIYQEFDTVAAHFPDLRTWIIADANFGILKRDIEIAKRLGTLRARNPKLQELVLWDAKNNHDRITTINRLVGNNALLAVQTLDPVAQYAVKRTNIRSPDYESKVRECHADGIRVTTHVMVPLPGETYESHLKTLSQCFEIGFDNIHIITPVLLQGTEMESEASRLQYGLRTRFQSREESFGQYNGIRSIECEEIIHSTNTITDAEILKIKVIHWLVWYGWTFDHLKPLFHCARTEAGLNPLDMMLDVLECDPVQHPLVTEFFNNFLREYEAQSFTSAEALKSYYFEKSQYDALMANGFTRAAHTSNAIMTLRADIFADLLELLADSLISKVSGSSAREVVRLMLTTRIDPLLLLDSPVKPAQKITVPSCILDYFGIAQVPSGKPEQPEQVEIVLKKPLDEQESIRRKLQRFGCANNPNLAVGRVIRNQSKAFNYHLEIATTGA